MTEEEKREVLAAFVHDMWAGWMIYLFQYTALFGGEYMLDGDKAERWIRQMTTDYYDLPESEKQSDREIADRLRNVLDGLR